MRTTELRPGFDFVPLQRAGGEQTEALVEEVEHLEGDIWAVTLILGPDQDFRQHVIMSTADAEWITAD